MNLKDGRDKFVKLTKQQLTGEGINTIQKDGEEIVEFSNPLERIFTGFLLPIMGEEDVEDEDVDSEEHDDEEKVNSVKKSKRYMPPSSAGFSFFITGKEINLRVCYNAKSYTVCEKVRGVFEKKALIAKGEVEEISFSPDGEKQREIFGGAAKIDVLWRAYNDGYIVTITLSNAQKIDSFLSAVEYNIEKAEKTLFEVELKCIVEDGNVNVYPSKNRALLTDEEKEIELRYKDMHTYAVGHGTAVDWGTNDAGQREIYIDFMPRVEVPQVTADTAGESNLVLQLAFLKDVHKNNAISELSLFIEAYKGWIEEQRGSVKTEDNEDKITAENIVEKQLIAQKRMLSGIELLKNNEDAKLAFALANEAMLNQWVSTDKNKNLNKDESEYRWRPFQLAFIIMTLESVVNEDSEFRDSLDLIWFPTGGGKTEAYLGIMAFLFIYRRLKYSSSANGTVAIMRYTLRLLTAQQFLRASKVVCALELMRQDRQDTLGEDIFSIGLWVGGASSPNTFKIAMDSVSEENFEKLIFTNCPWCNALFRQKNYIAKENSFHFSCTNSECGFGKIKDNKLPCNVVDEELYNNPPTLLIATVDKFARLAWDERASSFFGKNGNRSPELIIQDELHLISSALGSIVGLYEVGIETALIRRGVRAKYIASTATIKNATKQIKTLFAKDSVIFPPSGLRYNDSYFAKTVPLNEKPGRLYVGYMAPQLQRQNCLYPLAATLLSNSIILFKDSEEFLDKWWTQVVYHSSLKGVGNSRTLYQARVNAFFERLIMEKMSLEIDNEEQGCVDKNNLKTIEYCKNEYYQNEDISEPVKRIIGKYLDLIKRFEIKNLTSNQTAKDNAEVFEALALERDDEESINVVLATNMISVGLDVSRLALMIINGQPLTTAEYIQASSRVGRGETPGIVFENYYKTQSRSLSHYENFRSYHDSFYKFVEPSSVTPFTYQARTRALHAALVIAVRHSNIGLLENDTAEKFDLKSEPVKKVIQEMKRRCELAIEDKGTLRKTIKHIDDLANEWSIEVECCNQNKGNLVYFSNDKGSSNILCDFDKDNGLWKTLQSMRNVEKAAQLKLLGGLKNDFEER